MTGQFNLNKVLTDGRKSPINMIPPQDKDILITDQHTELTPEGDKVQYTRVVGIADNVRTEDGRLVFDWKITDPSIQNLVNNAKYPEKLFNYSPEHIPIDIDEEYPDGRTGIVEHIAITNSGLANDKEAITTRIFNRVMNKLKPDNGDNMENEVEEKINTKIEDMIGERLKVVDDLQTAIEGLDIKKLNEMIQKIEELPDLEKVLVDVEDLKKNTKQFIDNDSEEWSKLVKNVKTNSGISEDTLHKMGLKELQELDSKFKKNSKGVGESGGQSVAKTIVDEINEQYGTDVGKTLFNEGDS